MNQNNIAPQDFSKYDKMSVEELAAIGRRDLLAPPEEQLGADELIYISQLYCRRTGGEAIFTKSAEEAFAQFEQHYMPKEPGEVARQLKREEADLQDTSNLLQQLSQSKEKTAKKSRRTLRRYMQIAAIVAAVISLVIVPVNASGQTVFKTIVLWAKETFQFADPNRISTEGFVKDTQFRDFLLQHRVTASVPTLIPEGYTLIDTSMNIESDHISCQALYQLDEESFLSASVYTITPENASYVEQAGETYEGVQINGAEYFLFSNMQNTIAVWNFDSYQHVITAPISKEEMKIMLYSIPKQ